MTSIHPSPSLRSCDGYGVRVGGVTVAVTSLRLRPLLRRVVAVGVLEALARTSEPDAGVWLPVGGRWVR